VVKTRQTLRVEPEMVDSIYKLQPVYVTFVNEFAMSIVGELSVEFPPLWDADPETFFVRLKPGETFRRQTHLLVPYNAIAGPQEVRVTLDLGGSGTQKTRITRQVELGSSTFRMDVETHPTAGELAVYQKVTNASEAAADVSAFLEAEGLARKEQPPRVLPSGSSTTFVYRLQGESQWAGRKLRLAVRDRNTDRFLNVELTVPASGAPR